MTNRGKVGVVLPFNAPSPMLDEISSKIFHPATLPISTDKRKSEFKFPNCFSGYSSIALGVKMGFDVTVMVSAEDTPATRMLRACVDNFVDPANPFADILVQQTKQQSIAGQLEDFFVSNEEYDSALVIWPYQIFHEDTNMFLAHGDADFVYTHPLMKLDKSRVPECIAVAPRDINATSEMECANAISVGTVDSMLKGSFTRILTAVEVSQWDFMKFVATSVSPGDISLFLGEYLKSKRGILINPDSHTFIV